MNYRQVVKEMCWHAAQHLYSLETYEDFDEKDTARVDRALLEIQIMLWSKAGSEVADRLEREATNA